MKIYTRKGDDGSSRLFDGTKMFKSGLVFDVLGDLDELSVAIGSAIVDEFIKNDVTIFEDDREVVFLDTFLRNLQVRILDINSVIARAESQVTLDPDFVSKLESMIDFMTEKMPPLQEFILPGVGTGKDVLMHTCRVICRRAERTFCKLITFDNDPPSDNLKIISKTLNRLSDMFFTLARYVGFLEGQDDVKRS